MMNLEDELESLRNKIINCKACDIYNYWKKPISFQIGQKTDIFCMAREPGKTEIEKGIPLIGDSGQELNIIFKESGLDREDITIGNSGNCRKDNNQPYTFQEYQHCFNLHSKKLIEVLNPKFIIILGREALETEVIDSIIGE